jgi:hypothetical protein
MMSLLAGNRPEPGMSEHQDAVSDAGHDWRTDKERQPKQECQPQAPPRNSARSVAIAASSLTIHTVHTTAAGIHRGSARLRPVTMPSCQQSVEQHGDQIGASTS